MRIGTLRNFGIIVAILAASGASAATSPSAATGQAAMTTGGLTSQPIGHYEFCASHLSECQVTSNHAVRVKVTNEDTKAPT